MDAPQPSSFDFTAIDFETANTARASACAVGLAKVREGVVVDTASWLIKPPSGIDSFHARNVGIHGITSEMVAASPTWERVFADVMSFVGADALLAHNAPFDRSVLQQACSAYDLDWPVADWYDTLPMSRRLLTLGSYSLPFVAQALELEELAHHEALSDAVQAANIAIALKHRAGADTLAALASLTTSAEGAHSTRLAAGGDGSHAQGDFSTLTASDVLAGESIVFTGTLTLSTRNEALALVEHFGGTPQKDVTKKTTILVSGDLDPRTFRPGARMTSKLAKAMALAEKGQPIEIWTEDDLHDRLAVGREALEAATRAQRVASRSSWLPTHIVEQARALTDSAHEYMAWLRAALRHPDGRPSPDSLCVRCGGPFGAEAYWLFLERWVCSGDCNEALKRAAKRAWASAGLSRPAAPSYAETYGRR